MPTRMKLTALAAAGLLAVGAGTVAVSSADAAAVTRSQVVKWCNAHHWTCTPPAPTPTPSPSATPSPSSQEITAYITGYTYWDNTPPGSADISHPVLHKQASGTGTYADPITMAVGHSLATGQDVLDYPAGTRFYLPYLQRYFIVEDTCGDGGRPENGPCHTGFKAPSTAWVDVWLDGSDITAKAADACARRITDNHQAIRNPSAGLPVASGPICAN